MRLRVVCDGQNLGTMETGVGVGVGVDAGGNDEEVVTRLRDEMEELMVEIEVLVGAGDGEGISIAVDVVAIVIVMDVGELTTKSCELVGETLVMLLLGVGVGNDICKSLTAVPLEHNTNMMSVTLRVLSAVYNSTILESSQS